MTKPFRKDFLWGFATAAAQIEGGGEESEKASGRGDSIWDVYCDTPGKIDDGSHIKRTCGHLDRFKEDVALLAKLGVNSYRFSISWPRLIPLGGRNDPINEKGFQFYDDLINELLKHNITPFVTLFHWDLPQALFERYGGWLNQEESVADYAHYAKLCFERYGDRVKYWLTFNEPWCTAAHGHYHGKFAPDTEPWIVGHSLIIAHATAAKIYLKEFKPKQKGIIGITLNGDWTEPYDDSPENVKAAQNKMDVAVGWFADPIYLGRYPAYMKEMLGDKLPEFTQAELDLLKGSSEFFGANTYTTNMVSAGGTDLAAGLSKLGFEDKDGKLIGWESDMDWHRAVPWGVKKYFTYLWQRYHMPIYVTENGYPGPGESSMTKEEALKDDLRIKYYDGYLSNIVESMQESGVDLRSYFAWSFMDNFEWNSGLVPRFGCVYVDYKTFERTPKNSAYWIAKFFKENIPQ